MIIDKLAGLVAPNICLGCGVEGAVLCKRCMINAGEPPQPRCAGCRALSKDYKTCSSCRGWLGVYAVYASNEYEGLYEQLVHSLKFDMKRSTIEPISKTMVENIPLLPPGTIVCPLPTAPSRIRQRGFDHIKVLVKAYMKLLPKQEPWSGWSLRMLLGRRSNVRQLGSSRAQRIAQIEKEFYVKARVNVKGKTVLLFDDVMTTGASLSAAAKTLKAAGAKRVYAVVFAQKT